MPNPHDVVSYPQHTSTTKSWIVYGPSGCGKTKHSQAIAKALGVRHVNDGWDGDPSTYRELDTLHLTNALPAWAAQNRRALAYADVIRHIAG